VNANTLLALAAGMSSAALAAAATRLKQRSLATWCFSAGMLVFALESLFGAIGSNALLPERAAFWETLCLVTKSFLPGVWLTFSLTYSRANYRDFLVRSRWLVIGAFLIPVLSLAALYRSFYVIAYEPPFGEWGLRLNQPGIILNVLILVSTVLILMNIERTIRAAVGTMRWRIKFLVLGLGVIFGARIYTGSQALLFSDYSPSQLSVEATALLIGSALIAVAYFRTGFNEIDVYPSRAVLHTSVTVLLTGAYLIVVGVLAQVVSRFGGTAGFPIAAFVVLLSLAILAILLLSDRAQQSLQLFVSRHFKRPQHDFRQIWARFTRSLSVALDDTALGTIAARLISETFGALSVSTWLFDENGERLIRVSSTSDAEQAPNHDSTTCVAGRELNSAELIKLSRPFDLGRAKEKWARDLMERSSGQFRTGGSPICVPLVEGESWLGVIVLADRVRGLGYSAEEMDLLKCIGEQVAATLLKLRLTEEIMERKELEAFQTMSAFLIHDLKNAASTLGLMLENLPTHFDNPAFREDAFRGIGSAAGRINQLISRMNSLRHELLLKPAELDLNFVVTEALATLNGTLENKLVTKFDQVPKILADGQQLQSVCTNLLLNACDAVGMNGRITVKTTRQGEWVALSVTDNGCGMSEQFIKNSLFRPFRSTKKKGLGIGMFQSKTIVEAHQGKIHVESELGVGTTFRVMLPLKCQTA
jgi:putative PEP-CTERM system histidine kinase